MILLWIILFVGKTLGEPETTFDRLKFPNLHHNFDTNHLESITKIVEILTKKYDVIIHYENETSTVANAIAESPTTATTLHNYDTKTTRGIDVRKRYSLHVVMLGNPNELPEPRLEAVVPGDLVLFIGDTHRNYGAQSDTSSAARALSGKSFSLYHLEYSEELVTLCEMCFYCGEHSEKFRFVSKIELDRSAIMAGLVEKQERWRLNDFNRHTFNVAFISAGIYFKCENQTSKTLESQVVLTYCEGYSGIEAQILLEMKRSMNFEFQLITGPPIAKMGPWMKTIYDVNGTYADWGLGGISMTYERSKRVTFSLSIGNDPMKVLYAIPDDVFGTGKLFLKKYN